MHLQEWLKTNANNNSRYTEPIPVFLNNDSIKFVCCWDLAFYHASAPQWLCINLHCRFLRSI